MKERSGEQGRVVASTIPRGSTGVVVVNPFMVTLKVLRMDPVRSDWGWTGSELDWTGLDWK